ncbi:hypothetical protein CBR_g54644 [Chara braunii]|uniref:Uncharacterized protein n=1 Tax=Chara braunii TaxID=69332 RepID=A0A388MCK6_CHABU|nr:hypothetical protein CBR_g54644 [Chara braunii]|eukprot:GBG92199.1 hypothetical protein CBR_g54644 [Chara braunii]
MEVEPSRQGERDGRAQVPGDYRLEEDRVREMIRACFEEGILPTNIDPGEMEVSGREVKFTLNSSLDEIKIKWLKERMVTVIFRDGARFLPKKVKEDVIRAYEDVWIRDEVFGEEFKRGRIKIESPNVVSYIPRAQDITDWMLQKKSDFIDLAGTTYRTEFKPWLTSAEIRDWRQLLDQNAFWVVAVGIPLDEMRFIHVHVEKAIGKVLKQHKPESDDTDPKLVNLRFDINPACKDNMKDKFSIQTCQGDVLEVRLAGPDSDWCKRCRSFFHTESTCRRPGRRGQGATNLNQPQVSTSDSRQPRPSYNGDLRAPGAATQQAGQPSGDPLNVPVSSAVRTNPMFSPAGVQGQHMAEARQFQGLTQGNVSALDTSWADYFRSLPPHPYMVPQAGAGTGSYQVGLSPSMANLHAFTPWSSAGMPQGGLHGNRDGMLMQVPSNVSFGAAPSGSGGGRLRGELPGKERRISDGGVEIQVDLQAEGSDSSTGSQATPSAVGQLEQLEADGLRLFPLSWLYEGRKPELRRIRVSPSVSAEFLSDINMKLGRDKKLDSPFMKRVLTEEWAPLVPLDASEIQATGTVAPDGQA